jgi:hypothetical protein
MPITTWSKVQDVLDLDDSQETLVDTLIPLVEEDYLQIRNKPFETGETLTIDDPATADGDVTVTIITSAGAYEHEIEVNSGDDETVVAQKIYLVLGYIYGNAIEVEEEVVTIKGKGFVLSFDGGDTGVTATTSGMQTFYSNGAEMTAIRMIKYQLDSDKIGVKSESLGDYSISYDTAGGVNYPKSIMGGIKRYASWT